MIQVLSQHYCSPHCATTAKFTSNSTISFSRKSVPTNNLWQLTGSSPLTPSTCHLAPLTGHIHVLKFLIAWDAMKDSGTYGYGSGEHDHYSDDQVHIGPREPEECWIINYEDNDGLLMCLREYSEHNIMRTMTDHYISDSFVLLR